MDRFTELPLTQGQLLLWTGQELNPGDPLYNIPHIFELTGPIDPFHFQAAFQVLVNQSDTLRTVFMKEGGLPVQRIYDTFPYELRCIQLASSDELESWIEERKKLPFDIAHRNFDSVLLLLPEDRNIWYFNQHHLISDAWSVSVLSQKMGELYQLSLAGSLGEASPLPRFADYLSYEQSARFNKENEPSRLFWEQRAGELPVPPRLYGEKGSPSETRSERLIISLGKERSDQLRALTKEKDLRAWTADMSLFNIFSTVLFVFLHRVSGQKNIAIGSPAHNRPTPTFKQTPGVFIELFPLVAEIEEGESFQNLFKRMAIQSNEFLRHAKPGASSFRLSRQFNVVLNFIHTKFGNFGEMPMKGEWLHPGHSDSGHHLRLQVHDLNHTGDIQLNFDLNTSVFPPNLRQGVPQHFLQVLDHFIEDRYQDIDTFPLEEEPALLPAFPTPLQGSGADTSVLDLFQEQVEKNPEATALELGSHQVSFERLHYQSNFIAHQLKEQGIRQGDRVGIYMNRSIAFIASLLGAWKAGATYIPLPSDTPSNRMQFILEDAQAKLLISQEALSEKVADLNLPLLLLENSLQEEMYSPSFSPLGSDLAYIMYTSGSTGQPKGVMISHAALSNYMGWARKAYATDSTPTFPLFSKIGFDLTVTSQFVPLTSGGKLIIYPEKGLGTDLSILDVIEENRVNVVKLTPSHLALLKDQDLEDSQIRTLIVGGEDFPTELAGEITQKLGSEIRIFNEYGPTEATVGCVVHQFDPTKDTQASVPIGLPIEGIKVYVLDSHKQAVPQGVPGELYITGKSLAKGYVNRKRAHSRLFY